MGKLTHTDESGRANMVDVADKVPMIREARAQGFITLNEETIALVKENGNKKGDVLSVAEVAGIMAAKDCARLIPLCHTLNLTKVQVRAELNDNGVEITSYVKCIGKTGVEMEALTGVSVGLLTIYDMCKATDKNMVISGVRLVEKVKKEL